jgi:hypothetical protein
MLLQNSRLLLNLLMLLEGFLELVGAQVAVLDLERVLLER